VAEQSYAAHTHQPWLFTVGAGAWLAAAIVIGLSWFFPGTLHVGLFLLLAAVGCAVAMGRVYITRLQDRIIRLEMRVRCAGFLSTAQLTDLERLSMKQIVALRFASDAEIPGLIDRALEERLTPDEIKKAVVHWIPDHHRT
jgi:hypothetical protein